MSLFASQRENCFCAFCKSPKKIYRTKRINFSHIAFSMLASVALMWGIWEEVNPAAILFFISFLIFAEVFIYLRWRVSLMCRQCGFDPSIYLKNPEIAAERVKAFLERRKADPNFLLAPSLDLPKRRAPRSTHKPVSRGDTEKGLVAAGNKGKFVSKSV